MKTVDTVFNFKTEYNRNFNNIASMLVLFLLVMAMYIGFPYVGLEGLSIQFIAFFGGFVIVFMLLSLVLMWCCLKNMKQGYTYRTTHREWFKD